jgi:hypothetical protein
MERGQAPLNSDLASLDDPELEDHEGRTGVPADMQQALGVAALEGAATSEVAVILSAADAPSRRSVFSNQFQTSSADAAVVLELFLESAESHRIDRPSVQYVKMDQWVACGCGRILCGFVVSSEIYIFCVCVCKFGRKS